MMVKLVKVWAYASAILASFVVAFLFGYVFFNGYGSLSWSFLASSPSGAVLGSEGGIAPAIVGSLWFVACALALGGIPALVTAIYTVFYSPGGRFQKIVHGVMRVMTGVPSIVMGMFSYSFLIVGFGLKRSVFAGSVALALMILPFIEIRVEKALRSVPQDLTLASYSLGCSHLHTLCHVALPWCRGEVISAFVLGACYAMGAMAPLIFTGGVAFAPIPEGIDQPAMALPLHLYLLIAQGNTMPQVYGTAFVLMVIVLISNLTVAWYAHRRRNRWNRS